MRRRAFLLGGMAGAMLVNARPFAQEPGRQYRVGVISPLSGLSAAPYISALRDQLAKHGFVEGRNLAIEVRFPLPGRGPVMAATQELLAKKPDVIVACTSSMVQAASGVAAHTPVVFAWVGDPVGSSLVKDLARPGGNATGVTNRFFELAGKRVELLHELLPSAKHVVVATGYFDAAAERAMQDAKGAAERLNIKLSGLESGGSWSSVVRRSKAMADALMVLIPFPVFGMRLAAEETVRHALEERFPVIYGDSETVEAGGLISYATSLAGDMRRAADLVARILGGEKPAVLPVDQAARFELVINLKTARAMGLEVPRSLLVRADRVIE